MRVTVSSGLAGGASAPKKGLNKDDRVSQVNTSTEIPSFRKILALRFQGKETWHGIRKRGRKLPTPRISCLLA